MIAKLFNDGELIGTTNGITPDTSIVIFMQEYYVFNANVGGFERAKAQRVSRIEYTPRELSDPEPRLPLDDGCTIILHPNNDGTYHWMCPNCNVEDLGLSTETNLADYLPVVTCPGCRFQFGVDKRYLIKPQNIAKTTQNP